MHLYLFLMLFGACTTFLLASFFIKNSDEHDKYTYKLICALIAFIFFFSIAPMSADIEIIEPYVNSTYTENTYANCTVSKQDGECVIQNYTTTYDIQFEVYHYEGSYLFGWVCQGFGYVALALAMLFALAMVHDLYQAKRRGG